MLGVCVSDCLTGGVQQLEIMVGVEGTYPLVMTNIAMGNGPFIDGLPIKNGDFPWQTVR